MSKDIVIAGYKRTPFHFANKGALAKVRPDDLALVAVKALLDEAGIDGKTIEDVIMGCAFPEGEQGFNIGKIVAQMAGLPITVAGVTVNRFCGSAMQAMHMAAGAIQMNAGEAFICGGVESMTRIPMGGFNPMPHPEFYKEYPAAYMSMGETAENVAKKYAISRADQEEFAVASHHKAAKAQEAGHFKQEIIAVGDVDKDGTIRPDSSVEALAELKPAFDKDGVVTAGTSSPLTDGAVATLVCTADYAKTHGLTVMAKIKSIAVAGCAAEIMGMGPINASNKALERAGLAMNDIDIIELNEAFASQALAVIREMNIDQSKVNLDGGAIALGHPLGASGARITGKAAHLLQREKKSLALATMCIGGGQGIATILEAV